MIDRYEQALHHLTAAYAAMTAAGDTLALATIAQALSVIEAGCEHPVDHGSAIAAPANRLPC